MELWHFEFLKESLKTRKSAKIGLLSSSFQCFAPRSPGGNPFKPVYPKTTEVSALGEKGPVLNGPRQRPEKSLNLVQPISPYNSGPMHFGS